MNYKKKHINSVSLVLQVYISEVFAFLNIKNKFTNRSYLKFANTK